MRTNKAVFTKDTANNKIIVVRSFNAPPERVWKAWTDSTILDQWWAPQPYRAETKTMDLRVGGTWFYCMVGPEGDRQWCKETFRAIDPQHSVSSAVCFADENGNENHDFPVMYWKRDFSSKGDSTEVRIEVSFDQQEDMEQIIATGFEEGFTAGMNNLDAYLEKASD